LAAGEQQRFRVIDAAPAAELVSAAIWQLVEPRLKMGA